MPYTPTTWVQGTTPVNATNQNHLETQYTESTLSFNPDLFSPFVLTGLVCTTDGTTLNQLDVTAGTAYLLQTDGTLRQRKTAASTANQFLTTVINTTYFLDLNPDGTFSFGTSHSGVTGHITICSATTNASGNISGVTDARSLTVAVFPGSGMGQSGLTTFPGGIQLDPALGGTNTLLPSAGHMTVGSTLEMRGAVASPSTGPATAVVAGTALGVGAYSYKVTFGTDDGETAAGPTAAATTTTNNQAVNLSAIPTSTDAKVFKRAIYRTKVGGSVYFLLTTIFDNTTTTFADTTADGSLGAAYNPRQTAGGSTLWFNNALSITAYVSGATGQVFFDGGAFTTDGAGNAGMLSVNFSGGPSGSQGKIDYEGTYMTYRPPESGATAQGHTFQVWTGSTAPNPFGIGSGAFSGVLALFDDAGNLAKVGGIGTLGRGVPIFTQRTIDQNVVNTTNVVVCSINAPAVDTVVRVSANFFVGSGNTNNGTCTLKVVYTDALSNTVTTTFPVQYGFTTTFNGTAVTKGASIQTVTLQIEARASTGITLQYQNSAAGTISDFVTGIFEWM